MAEPADKITYAAELCFAYAIQHPHSSTAVADFLTLLASRDILSASQVYEVHRRVLDRLGRHAIERP